MTTVRAICVWVALIAIGACQRTDRSLTVFAAASLREVFTRLGEDFERAHGVKPTFNFAGSQELRAQLEHGAPADLFAAADEVHMGALLAQGLVAEPQILAGNGLIVVLSDEARTRIETFADLPKAERIAIGGDTVPVGRYTLQMLDKADQTLGPGFRARVEARVTSRELNTRQVLARVTLGEADAGVVYRTDAATTKLATVPVPPELDIHARYPIAALIDSPHPELAQRFIAHLTGPAGRRALTQAGFTVVPAP